VLPVIAAGDRPIGYCYKLPLGGYRAALGGVLVPERYQEGGTSGGGEEGFLIRADEAIEGAASFSHSWNPNSEIRGTHLSRLVRLSRTSVSLVRIPPGKECFVYQSPHRREEWIYVISGRAIAKIDGEEYEVAAGVFTGFPTQWWLTVCATR
jgi:Cupin domain